MRHDVTQFISPDNQEIWCLAALRETFSPGELYAAWEKRSSVGSSERMKSVRQAIFELQEFSETASVVDEQITRALPSELRETILAHIGAAQCKSILQSMSQDELKSIDEGLRALLLEVDVVSEDFTDSTKTYGLAAAVKLARSAGVPVSIDTDYLLEKASQREIIEQIGGNDLANFIGRAKELSLLRERWHSNRQFEAAFVEGPGGIGKSHLLAQFASELWAEDANARPDAVFHIDFDRPDLNEIRVVGVLQEFVRQASRLPHAKLEEFDHINRLSLQGGLESASPSRSGDVGQADNLLERLVAGLSGNQSRLLVIVDSAENVLALDNSASESPLFAAVQLAKSCSKVMIVYCSRAYPEDWITDISRLFDRALGDQSFEIRRHKLQIGLKFFNAHESEAFLRSQLRRIGSILSQRDIKRIANAVGGSPLSLRLMAAYAEKLGPAEFDALPQNLSWLKDFRSDPDMLQAALYERILDRLTDPVLKKIARPGLLLRRISPEIIEHVLAGPCQLDLSKTSTNYIMSCAKREGQLFVTYQSEPGLNEVWHRPDVRASMLSNIDASVDEATFVSINRLAVTYYLSKEGKVFRTEELYHRLRLNEDIAVLDSRWTDEAGIRLRSAINDFSDYGRAYLRRKLKSSTAKGNDSVLRLANRTKTERDELREGELISSRRNYANKQLQSGQNVLQILEEWGCNSVDNNLGDIYAEALVVNGLIERLIREAGTRRAAPKNSPQSEYVRAGVLLQAACALEGQGLLQRAMFFSEDAMEIELKGRSFEIDDSDINARELQVLITFLRLRRKLYGEEDAIRGGHTSKALSLGRAIGFYRSDDRKYVLLREFVAEIGMDCSKEEFRQWFEFLSYAGAVFRSSFKPSEPKRRMLERAGIHFVGPNSAIHFEKLLYNVDESDNKELIVALLREEVDFTLKHVASGGSVKNLNLLARS